MHQEHRLGGHTVQIESLFRTLACTNLTQREFLLFIKFHMCLSMNTMFKVFMSLKPRPLELWAGLHETFAMLLVEPADWRNNRPTGEN